MIIGTVSYTLILRTDDCQYSTCMHMYADDLA